MKARLHNLIDAYKHDSDSFLITGFKLSLDECICLKESAGFCT